MADPDLVDLIKQGKAVWNHWRDQKTTNEQINLFKVDLSGADLRETDLSGADLREAILSEVDFSGANLRYAYLSGADLGEANLSGADLFRINLRGAYLSGADLSAANMREAELSGGNLKNAHLFRTNLRGAKLRNADLSKSDLRKANLNWANLSGADLSEANLDETDLFKADLSRANLNSANLEKTNWTNANAGRTQLVNLDLRTVIGLETVKHNFPSTISLDTIYKSHAQIPEIFLRGAGVPETFITNMRALVNSMSPIEFYSCFIAYTHHNEDFAKRLHADLQAQGVRCWFAKEDLKIGDHYHQRVDEAIRLYDKLIIILSEHAVKSTWVEREVVAAREKEERQGHEVLFPIRLDEAVMDTTQEWAADVRRRWHIGDFTLWKEHDHYQQAFDRLMRDLKAQNEKAFPI